MQDTPTLYNPGLVFILLSCSLLPEWIDIHAIDQRLIEPLLHIIQMVAGIAALLLSYRTLKVKK